MTFREQYKSIVEPYFGFDNLEYAVENENSVNERIQLIFRNEGFALTIRKDGMTFVYEGDVGFVKKSNPIIQIFFEIYEKIKSFKGYHRTTRHYLILNFVEVLGKTEVEETFRHNKFIHSPFEGVYEFASVFHFVKNDKSYKIQFGNYTEQDSVKFDISPFKTTYNTDLVGNVGYVCIETISEVITHAAFGKFKSLLEEGENTVSRFKSTIA